MTPSSRQPHTGARTAAMVMSVAFAALLVMLSPAVAFAADTLPPSVPANVTATPVAISPVVATIDWDASTDDVGVTGYTVWRSMTSTATPVRIGETTALTFDDESGVPGQPYYYFVSAFDAAHNESARSTPAAGPVIAGWTQVPHATYTSAGRYCRMCHAPHQAATQTSLMRQTDRAPGEISVCYACHDGQGASSNILSGPVNSFALTSGHTVEAAASGADLTNLCSGCHNAHVDYTSGGVKLPRGRINGTQVDGADNTWCLACHNDANDWYGAGYPSEATPSRDASGYPTYGTFPGRTVYEDPSANAHASIPASGTVRQSGDCLYCHASHRADNEFDALVATFTPSARTSVADDQTNGTYATSCFDCHGGVLRSEFTTLPVDIKQFVTAGADRSGHRVKTSGGNLPVGSPVPCYDCHNPHGSSRGNGELLADTLGQNLNTDTAANVRHTCFSCHSSGDGMVWDSVTSAYVAVAAQEVEGLRRDGSDGSVLSIPTGVTGHDSSHTQSCYQCHGQDYGTGGYNVHNPTGGVSPGGVDCYACHATYQGYMEDGGVPSTTVYHHVMGTGSTDGGTAFASGSYPTSTSNLYCMSCHADHDQFNASQSGNLRLSLSATANTAASDYATSGTYGICVSCHSTSLTKDSTHQANDGSTATPKIVGGTGAGGFGISAHNYAATSSFGDATSFSANCSKCHNDEQTKDFQTSDDKFGTHFSAARRLLSALGGTVTDPLAESHCYRCHSRTTDSLTGTKKSVANRDWYNATAMTAASERVYAQFQLAGSKHPVAATANGSVECESCHNAHVATSSAIVTDPDNTYNTLAYGTTAQQATYCLRCHDGTQPTRTVNATTYIPYSVTIAAADATIMNKNTYAARGHWTVNGSIGTAQSCALCHENHGSVAPKLLGAYDMTDSRNEINGTAITVNTNSVCYACHTSADAAWPLFTRSGGTSGYPTDGVWPGSTVYDNATTGIHRTGRANVVWPGSTTWAAGDCKNCHDVHGTANTYDELRGTFSTTNFSTCLGCHDADGPSSRNIAQYYWISSGGSATSGTDRYSHDGDANVATPCYDCHNPHGSASADGLLVVTQISSADTRVFGDAAGEFDLTTTQGVRDFCLSCHVINAATNLGYSGTAGTSVTIQNTAVVDGYNRLSQLKITQAGAAHTSYTGNNCVSGACHANPHAPS